MQIMKNGRARRTGAERRALVSGWKVSGQGVREYCREHEIQSASFQRWRREFEGGVPEGDFVAVTRTSAPPPSAATVRSWKLEVELPNGCRLRFQS